MKVKEILTSSQLFVQLNTAFTNYARSKDPQKYASAALFNDPAIAYISYLADYGELKASDLLEQYHDTPVTIEKIINLKYFRNWLRLYDLEHEEYNPLYNVDGKEKRIIATVFGKAQTSEQIENATSTTSEYGYDATTSDETLKTETDGGKTKVQDSGTETVTDTFERSGNIGVTMSQQMFEAEAKLLESWNFIEAIFKDINNELTYHIWEV